MLALCQEGILGSYLPIISLFIYFNCQYTYKILSFVCKRQFVAIINTTAVRIV